MEVLNKYYWAQLSNIDTLALMKNKFDFILSLK
jgi:hypothetical protein